MEKVDVEDEFADYYSDTDDILDDYNMDEDIDSNEVNNLIGNNNNDDEYDDEQHTQKINGQIENLQLQIELLKNELLTEKRNHEETRRLMTSRGSQENESTIKLKDIEIKDLKEKIFAMEHKPSISLNNEFINFSGLISFPSPSMPSHLSDDDCISILRHATKAIKDLKYMTSQSSASGPSLSLRNELVQFYNQLKSNNSMNTIDISDMNDDRCIDVIKDSLRLYNELFNKSSQLENEIKFSSNASEDIRALKSKIIQLIERIRIEKLHRAKAELDSKILKKKLIMLTDHIAKLMIHLKHEAAVKVRTADQLRASEREFQQLKETCELIQKKSQAKDRLIIEIKEGSKILEDQLRLMDEKYLELRSKLDWAREVGAAKLKRAEKVALDLRVKYALSTNSTLSLDNVPLPDIYPNGTHLGLNKSMVENDPLQGGQFSNSLIMSKNSKQFSRSLKIGNDGGSNRINATYSSGGGNGKIVKGGSKQTTPSPSMDHVLEKLRTKENKRREWTDEKLKKLISTK